MSGGRTRVVELGLVGVMAGIFLLLPKPPQAALPMLLFIPASIAQRPNRNLWPLGLVHGWLGSLFYPWVLGINPLAAFLGELA